MHHSTVPLKTLQDSMSLDSLESTYSLYTKKSLSQVRLMTNGNKYILIEEYWSRLIKVVQKCSLIKHN